MSAHYAMCKYDDATGSYIPLEVRPITDKLKKDDPLYQEGFQAGAASRDAEVVSLTNQRDYEYVRAENAEHDKLLVKTAAKDAEIAELVAALESVEWIRLGEMPEGSHCCYCGALKKHGHVTGCKVANVLKRTTLAQALAKARKS